MSLSQSLSSSTLSQKTLGHKASDSKTSADELSESSSSIPTIRVRSHVLDGMPEDIRRYWLFDFILDWSTSHPADIAKTLHHMAAISKEHQEEVIRLVQNEPDIAMHYTAHAMRGLADAATTLPPKDKSRARRYLLAGPEGTANENDIDVYNFELKVKKFAELYPVSSVDLSTNERKEFHYPEWIRAALQAFLDPALGAVRVRLNFSIQRFTLMPLQKFNINSGKIFCDYAVYKPPRIDDSSVSPIRVISKLIAKFKENNRKMYAGPIIELIIKNNLTALHELNKLPSELHIDLIDASGMRASSGSIKQTFHRNDYLYLATGFDLEPLSNYLTNDSCQLTTLILHDCTLDASALFELAVGLEKNTSVNTLDLSKNFLRRPGISGPDTYDGLTKFSCILAASTSLLHLNLANCSLRDEGAALLHEALKANPYLQTINLTSNMISHDHPIWSDTRAIGNSAT